MLFLITVTFVDNPLFINIHSQRTGHSKKMADAIALEKVDEEGNPLKKHSAACPSWKPHEALKQLADTSVAQNVSMDEDDQDYELPTLDTPSDSDSDGGQSDVVPSNAEVRHFVSSTFIILVMTC